MYKLLIVDDNESDRRGIMRHVNWEELGVVTADAANGKLGLEKALAEKPDIVLTDISMPYMNGIEMTKQIIEQNDKTQVIFMSCFDDFDFALSGIKMGVADYILKPIEIDNLTAVVKNAIQRIEEHKNIENTLDSYRELINKNHSLLTEQFFTRLLFRPAADEALTMQPPFPEINAEDQFRLTLIMSSSPNTDMVDAFAKQLLLKEITENAFCEDKGSYFISCDAYVLGVITDTNSITLNKQVKIFETIQNDFYKASGEKATVCISSCALKMQNLNSSFRYLLQMIKTERFTRADSLTVYNDLSAEMPDMPFLNPTDISSKINKLLDSGNSLEVNAFVNSCFDTAGGIHEIHSKILCFYIVNTINIYLIEKNESFTNIFGSDLGIWKKLVNFNTIQDIKQWIRNILDFTIKYLQERLRSGDRSLVEKIKTRIDTNYASLLSLNQIVDGLYVSTSYANKLFHEQTGKTIYYYLQEVRINEAMRLLTTTNMKHLDIAKKLGYQSNTYFTTAFKKYVGVSPKEYRRIKSDNKAIAWEDEDDDKTS